MWSDVVWMRGIQEVIQRSVIGFILHACLSPSYPLCCAILHHRILHILWFRLELILSYVVQYYITEYYIFYRFGLSPSYPLLCNISFFEQPTRRQIFAGTVGRIYVNSNLHCVLSRAVWLTWCTAMCRLTLPAVVNTMLHSPHWNMRCPSWLKV